MLLQKRQTIIGTYLCKKVFHWMYVMKKSFPGGLGVGTLQK